MRLSVIVPVFNSEKTLSKCIDSILSQSFTDYELILINDGSLDSSLQICEGYAKIDDRVKVISQTNSGVSVARNQGLQRASGDYVTFVDSDDTIGENYFQSISDCNDDADLIVLQCSMVLEGSNSADKKEKIQGRIIREKEQLNSFLCEYLCYYIMRCPWGKFYRRSIVVDIRFNAEQNIGEDTLFVLQTLPNVKSIRVVDNVFYNWTVPAESAEVKYSLPIQKSIDYLSNIYTSFEKLSIKSPAFENFIYSYYMQLCWSSIQQSPSAWFNNPTVQEIWSKVQYSFPIKVRIKTMLYSMPLFHVFRSLFKK